jgi:hypothetical protein
VILRRLVNAFRDAGHPEAAGELSATTIASASSRAGPRDRPSTGPCARPRGDSALFHAAPVVEDAEPRLEHRIREDAVEESLRLVRPGMMRPGQDDEGTVGLMW